MLAQELMHFFSTSSQIPCWKTVWTSLTWSLCCVVLPVVSMFRLVSIDLLHGNGVGFSFRFRRTMDACIVIAKVADTVVFICVSFPPKTEVALVRHSEGGCLVSWMAGALFMAEDCTMPMILSKRHPCVLYYYLSARRNNSLTMTYSTASGQPERDREEQE